MTMRGWKRCSAAELRTTALERRFPGIAGSMKAADERNGGPFRRMHYEERISCVKDNTRANIVSEEEYRALLSRCHISSSGRIRAVESAALLAVYDNKDVLAAAQGAIMLRRRFAQDALEPHLRHIAINGSEKEKKEAEELLAMIEKRRKRRKFGMAIIGIGGGGILATLAGNLTAGAYMTVIAAYGALICNAITKKRRQQKEETEGLPEG